MLLKRTVMAVATKRSCLYAAVTGTVLMVTVYMLYNNNGFILGFINSDSTQQNDDNMNAEYIVESDDTAIGINGPLKYTRPFPEYNDTEPSKLNLSLLYHHRHKVLILTPVSNAGRHMDRYFQIINNFTYPHHLISVAIGEDSSLDDTLSKALELTQKYKEPGKFRKMNVYNLHQFWSPPTNDRHELFIQGPRRRHLAKARNRLLSYALYDEDYVLWIDSDISSAPANTIQTLIAAQKDLVVSSCLYRKSDDTIDDFDRNTWRETNESIAYVKNLPPEQLMIEGYAQTKRKYLWSLRMEGDVVPIDGVGGCVLLIRADCHRDGLTFPPFVFDHHIETEGLAKVAKKMGYSIYGVPRLMVFH